jgi:hypothetical protein
MNNKINLDHTEDVVYDATFLTTWRVLNGEIVRNIRETTRSAMTRVMRGASEFDVDTYDATVAFVIHD